jgi:hypothetical protein
MNAESTTPSRTEVVEEVSKWGVGLGILTVALAPLSIPIIVLTAVALLPLLLPVVALAAVAAPVIVVRRLRGGRRSGPAAEEEVLVDVELAPLHR